MIERYELEGGKYTILNDNGVITALRYGEPWREFVGDNLIGSLVEEVRRLHGVNDKLMSHLQWHISNADVLRDPAYHYSRLEVLNETNLEHKERKKK